MTIAHQGYQNMMNDIVLPLNHLCHVGGNTRDNILHEAEIAILNVRRCLHVFRKGVGNIRVRINQEDIVNLNLVLIVKKGLLR